MAIRVWSLHLDDRYITATLHSQVAIRVWSPLPLEADTVWDPLARNILVTLFQPLTVFDLTVRSDTTLLLRVQ